MSFLTHSFTVWAPLDTLGPATASVIQVKVAGELITYPGGRSAMLWYGVKSESLLELLPAMKAQFGERLRWRERPSDNAQADCDRLLQRFEARFESPPQWNL